MRGDSRMKVWRRMVGRGGKRCCAVVQCSRRRRGGGTTADGGGSADGMYSTGITLCVSRTAGRWWWGCCWGDWWRYGGRCSCGGGSSSVWSETLVVHPHLVPVGRGHSCLVVHVLIVRCERRGRQEGNSTGLLGSEKRRGYLRWVHVERIRNRMMRSGRCNHRARSNHRTSLR